MHRLLASVLILAPLSAQVDWSLVAAPSSPTAPFHTAFAFDQQRGVFVLFGGTDNATVSGDTHEFNGIDWFKKVPVTSPSPRWWARMTYDGARQEVVMFGGNGNLAETWTYDGLTWTQKSPLTVPTGRAAQGMWYDSKRQVVMMFGGTTATGLVADLWSWDGSDWSAVTSAHSPPPIYSIDVAYDPDRDRAVLFGGASDAPGGGLLKVDRTWEWDGSDWTEILTPTVPPGRWGNKVVYDPVRRRMVMSGGSIAGPAADDTWEYDGVQWHLIPTTGVYPGRENHAMVYDSLRQRPVIYGGYPPIQDTWEYFDRSAGRFVPYGYGCPGSAGLPSLTAAAGSVPVVGQTFLMEIAPVALFTPLVLGVVGLSRTQNGGVSLPFDLTVIGMPGCIQWVGDSHSVHVATILGTGKAVWGLHVPNDPGLVGVTFFPQGVVYDFGINLRDLIVTNAGEATIG